ASFIEERHNGLVFLADQGDEIGPPVSVEIADRDMNRAMPLIQDMRHKHGLGPVSRAVFQVRDLSGVSPAEDSNNQIELAVAVEIRGLNIGHAADAGEERDRRERAVRGAAQPNHASQTPVRGCEVAETSDNDVQNAITVQV